MNVKVGPIEPDVLELAVVLLAPAPDTLSIFQGTATCFPDADDPDVAVSDVLPVGDVPVGDVLELEPDGPLRDKTAKSTFPELGLMMMS